MGLTLHTAIFDDDGRFRYRLGERELDKRGGIATWIMLNPSIASATVADPTLRRVRYFTVATGHAGFMIVNLCALVATDPKTLVHSADPVGPMNDEAIEKSLAECRREAAIFAGEWLLKHGYFNGDITASVSLGVPTNAKFVTVSVVLTCYGPPLRVDDPAAMADTKKNQPA